mgnify:CR=1 FL=1
MSVLVVSQPMVFPWVGLFEQVRLADTYVHYDDVQLPQGRSFMTRVQVKTPQGINWLTIPICRRDKTLIRDIQTDESQAWRNRHLKTLHHCYSKAPFFEEMYALVQTVYREPCDLLYEFNIAGIEAVAAYFGFKPDFLLSSKLGTTTHSTQKLVDLALRLEAKRYITGLGALNYLEYDKFEEVNVMVEYMKYEKIPYPQLNGLFTPFVSILDLIANCGKDGIQYIRSRSIYWKDLLDKMQTT